MTSRLRKNLDREREILLDSLSVEDGRELFIELAGADLENPSEEKVELAIEKLVQKVGGHPLSIEIFARSYQGLGIEEIEGKMLKNLGLGVVNPEEESERLRTLEACFQYSINNLDEHLNNYYPNSLCLNLHSQ